MSTPKVKFFLILTLLLSLSVRMWKINKIPSGFFCDEASIGYNAFLIASKGVDEHGKIMPLFFKAFGEYKNPIQIYSVVPFIMLLGLNETSTRFPSVIYGVLSVYAIYLLTKEIMTMFSTERANFFALFSPLFLAVSPWHIHFSRTSLEGLTAFIFFTTYANYLFLNSIRLNILWKFYLSMLFFALALYSYFPARIFIPAFLAGILIIFFRKIGSVKLMKAALLFIVLLLPMLFHLFLGEGFSRFRQVSILSKKEMTTGQKVNHILVNYFGHFSPAFLFTKGDIDFKGQTVTRHSVRRMGELYSWQICLVILGTFFLVSQIKNSRAIVSMISLWLILYPTGSAFTLDTGPQATRSIIGVIPFQILSSLGLFFIYDKFKGQKKFLVTFLTLLLFIVIGFGFVGYLHRYFIDYPKISLGFYGWQDGPREIISYFRENQRDYDELIMTGSFNAPYIFLKFYAPYDCGNCKIGGLDDKEAQKKQLFALRPKELTIPKKDIIIRKIIFDINQNPSFIIFEVQNK